MEHFFICPYCFQRISVVLEELDEEQKYIEDCEVCCRPIQLIYCYKEGELLHFHADRSE